MLTRRLLLVAPAIVALPAIAEAANIIRPIAGSQSAYASAGFTATDFNSLAVGSIAVMPTTAAIDNTANLDDWIDVSFSLKNGATAVTGGFFGLYLLPLNQDGSTYGDGTVTGSTLPGASYWVTNAALNAGAANATLTGTFPSVWLPRTKFILGISNNLSGASAPPLNSAAAAAVGFKTTNLNGNG